MDAMAQYLGFESVSKVDKVVDYTSLENMINVEATEKLYSV